jgi:GH15 family glucan-1,4-alpha-glucosidase
VLDHLPLDAPRIVVEGQAGAAREIERVQRKMIEHLAECWDEPDAGIWEIRGPERQFTHSKVMVWVAFDRMIKSVERLGANGHAGRWIAVRDKIRERILEQGFDADLGSFVQAFGSKELDASLLLIPIVGFLPPGDARVGGTVAAIERTLLRDGLVRRYRTESRVDGIDGDEGVFLAPSFWLADNYLLLGRRGDAERLFQRLLSLRNDVGLLAEEYDPSQQRQLGNFPQAFSHVALINTARNLSSRGGPAEHRSR